MCKLLMIDDNQMEHLIVDKIFAHYNLFSRCEHSREGRTPLDFIKKHHAEVNDLPDLILLDLNMPKFSGWDFLANFKPVYPTLKKKIDIFVVSSSIDPKDKLRSKEFPFVKDFFVKPLQTETLIGLYSTYKAKQVAH